jgi:hypothetical protein
MAVGGGEREDPGPEADDSGNSTSPDRTAESYQDPDTYGDHANPEVTSPEQEAKLGSEEHLRRLLQAYKDTMSTVEGLPVVVWVPWDRAGLGRYFKVPYLRLFVKYFVIHHIDRSLNSLNRCFLETAALSSDPDANWTSREVVTLYLQSLPRLPYRVLIFAAILAALVIALPLQAFGNVFYVLDLAGALLRSDVTDVGKTFTGNDLGPTVRSFIVLLLGLIVVATLLTSPFGLKRILFNLHPWSRERLDSTAAREHGYRVEGLYALEDGVFSEAGIRRPHEGRWDLVFQTFLLSLLLVFGLLMAFLTLAVLLSWNVNLNVETGAPSEVTFVLPVVSWVYYAVFTGLVFAAFVLLLKRLLTAWKKRSRNAIG